MKKTIFIVSLIISLLLTSCTHEKHIIMNAELILDAKASLGEGAIWDQKEKILYWVDIEEGILHKFNPVSVEDVQFNLNKKIGTVVPSEKGGLLVALEDGIYHYNTITDSISFITNPSENNSEIRFNDGKCDPAGRLWAGTMSLTGKQKAGALYCLNNNGAIEKKIDSVSISNGIVWSLDNTKMYYIDTPTGKVREYSYDNTTGNISFIRDAVIITPDLGHPDGMTIDSKGNLWIALWGGSAVGCWNPDNGKLLCKINVPVLNVTSCAFGGENLETLFITTASLGIPHDKQEKYPYRGGLFKADPGVKGIPAYFYKGKIYPDN
ncbi:MAG: SMP-30/gluconolactonase/LRE family protein [Bacteroidetes bacterium]|nr:SMP-30/gluconolactonase/LRE family protein [Bacteroidota bacterium]